MKERYRIETNPLCRQENVKKGEHYRIRKDSLPGFMTRGCM